MRLIDEVAARERFQNNLAYMGTDVKRILVAQPTINPDDLRPRGRWKKRGNEKACSNCKFIYYSNKDEWSYCPNCGAKMDGKEQGDDNT